MTTLNLTAARCPRSELPAYSCWHCKGLDTPEINAFIDAASSDTGGNAPAREQLGSVLIPSALRERGLALVDAALGSYSE